MTLEHFIVSSGADFSVRTLNANEIFNMDMSKVSVSIKHYIGQIKVGSMLTHDNNFELVLIIPPQQYNAQDVTELLRRISKFSVSQIVTVCLRNELSVSGESLLIKSANAFMLNNFVDMTPYHLQSGMSGYVWLALDNAGSDKFLQMNFLKAHLNSTMSSTGYSMQNYVNSGCKLAV